MRREVATLPPREMVECWLCEGDEFTHRFWPTSTLQVYRVEWIEVALADLANGVTNLPIATYLSSDPAHPTAVWHANRWLQSCETYNTPSKNLEPGDYAIARRAGRDEIVWLSADGMQNRALLSEVTLARDVNGAVVDIQRTGTRIPLS